MSNNVLIAKPNTKEDVENLKRESKKIERKGVVSYMSKKFDQAFDEFDQAQKFLSFAETSPIEGFTEEEWKKINIQRALLLNKAAASAFNSQNYKRAIECASKTIEIVKENDNAHFIRGQSYRMLQNYEEASKEILEALKIKPGTQKYLDELDLIFKQIDEKKQEETRSIYPVNSEDLDLQRAIELSLENEKKKLDEQKLIEFYAKKFYENEQNDNIREDPIEEEDDVFD